MDAGKLDRRIVLLQRADDIDDGYETRPGSWESQGERWARYLPAMAREIYEHSGREEKLPAVFEVRSDSLTRQIDATWRIEFESRIYEVTGTQPIGRREYIRISATADDS
jgi:SPP1 family predicted phage head-tail adaptor